MASTFIYRTESAGNRRTFTWSAWIKRSKLGASQFLAACSHSSSDEAYFFFNGSDKLIWQSSSASYGDVQTNRVFRDTCSWYHIVLAVDTTQATASNRIRFYVNGVEETSFSTATYPAQDTQVYWNVGGTYYPRIGRRHSSGDEFDGLMSHVAHIDGTQELPTIFGETDSTTGEWKIKTSITPSSGWGTNGYHILKDGNSLTDQSGQGNNWTLGNGTLTKTEDNPSNIFATWNPLWSQSNGNIGDVTFSQGNLTTATSSNYRTTPTTLGMKSGKYYWEIKRNETASGDTHFGVMSENATPANTATWIGNAANGWIMASNGAVYTGGSSSGILSNGTVGNGAIFMGAYDGATGKLYFGVDGTWAGTANPSTGANPHYTLDTSLLYFPVVSTGDDVSANFGNGYFGTTAVSSAGTNASNIGIFEYDVPTGYTAWSTKGLNL